MRLTWMWPNWDVMVVSRCLNRIQSMKPLATTSAATPKAMAASPNAERRRWRAMLRAASKTSFSKS